MMRLMGLILMVIAVECFVSGFKPIMIDIATRTCKKRQEHCFPLQLSTDPVKCFCIYLFNMMLCFKRNRKRTNADRTDAEIMDIDLQQTCISKVVLEWILRGYLLIISVLVNVGFLYIELSVLSRTLSVCLQILSVHGFRESLFPL